MPSLRIDRLEPARSVMLVIDMENDFVAEGAPFQIPDARAMIPTLVEALAWCRDHGIRVIYTAHEHRTDGSDLGLFVHVPEMARGEALVAGTWGVEIYSDLAPHHAETVIRKNRFSAFYGTDLDSVLRGAGVDTVIISGTTTENCCHATARDALCRDYRVVFLSDATATSDFPDNGYGAMTADEVHRATLVILAQTTADVLTVEELRGLV
jgi:ureidoacrylate peracid hydrolase